MSSSYIILSKSPFVSLTMASGLSSQQNFCFHFCTYDQVSLGFRCTTLRHCTITTMRYALGSLVPIAMVLPSQGADSEQDGLALPKYYKCTFPHLPSISIARIVGDTTKWEFNGTKTLLENPLTPNQIEMNSDPQYLPLSANPSLRGQIQERSFQHSLEAHGDWTKCESVSYQNTQSASGSFSLSIVSRLRPRHDCCDK